MVALVFVVGRRGGPFSFLVSDLSSVCMKPTHPVYEIGHVVCTNAREVLVVTMPFTSNQHRQWRSLGQTVGGANGLGGRPKASLG